MRELDSTTPHTQPLSMLLACHKMQVFRRTGYQLASPALAEHARRASIYKQQWFSDHAPLTIEYDWTL